MMATSCWMYSVIQVLFLLSPLGYIMPLKVSVETRNVRVMSSELHNTPTSSTMSFSEGEQVSCNL